MDITLRDYQQECIKRVLASFEQNKAGRELLVLPTGSGKTIIFSQIIQSLIKLYGLVAIVIAHRDELLDQAADEYRVIEPDAVIGKIGSGVHEYGAPLTVASIATISRPDHIKRLNALYGTGKGVILITDEGHHSQADGYQRVYEALPDAFQLMVTATDDRLDGKLLLDGKPPLYSATIPDMVRQGYLCTPKAIAIRTETTLDNLHTQMGDYNEKELADAVDTPERNQRIVEGYLEHAPGRRAISFCVNVAHAIHLAQAFNKQNIAAAMVDGETPRAERKIHYRDLHTGAIRNLTNVMVLTEGFNEPLVDCIIMARPTQSRALYVQAIGRGSRLAPGKKDFIVLDITDNCLKHRLEPQNLSKAIGKNMHDGEDLLETLAREEKELSERETQVRKLPEKRATDIHINLLEKLLWQSRSDGKYVLEVGFEKHRIALVPVEDAGSDLWGQVGYYRVAARLAPHFEFQWWSAHAMPLDYAQQEAERKARLLLADPKSVKLVDRNASWRTQLASEKQLESLAKYQARFHLQYDPAMITRGEASDMLDPVYEQFRVWAERKKVKVS